MPKRSTTRRSPHTQLAPLPFDLEQDNLVIPANQYYNPFGVEFGRASDDSDELAIPSDATRQSQSAKFANDDRNLAMPGSKAAFGDSSWTWDANFGYGKLTREQQQSDYINYCKRSPMTSAAPPHRAREAAPRSTSSISTIRPRQAILKRRGNLAVLERDVPDEIGRRASDRQRCSLCPPATSQLAVGGDYRKEYLNAQVDPLIDTTFNNSGGMISR